MLSSLQHTENATTRPKAVWDIISKLKKWAEAVIIPRLYSKEDYYQTIWMNKLLEHCVKETSLTLVKQRWTATSKKTLRLCRVRFLVSSRRFVSWEATPTAGRMKEFPPRRASPLFFMRHFRAVLQSFANQLNVWKTLMLSCVTTLREIITIIMFIRKWRKTNEDWLKD